MALVLADRVKETSTTSGTGTLTLAGAVAGFQSFSVIGNGNTTYYTIVDSAAGTWEVGIGTYTASGTTLSRDTILSNSSGTTAAINFASNSKDVFVTYPSGKAVYEDASDNVNLPGNLVVTGTITSPSIGGNYVLNKYTSPATWTKPSGLKAVKVTVVGAGGAGGDARGTAPSYANAGGGGGGGAAILYLPAPSIPGPVSVTAGPGTNSFGPYNPGSPAPTVTASATAGTSASPATPGGVGTVGGTGGAGSGGTVNTTGGAGGTALGGPGGLAGVGGNSMFGGGAYAQKPPGQVNGIAGNNYGGGGSGAVNFSSGNVPTTGGAGAPGIVIIEEFY